jgi:hypothetical protein
LSVRSVARSPARRGYRWGRTRGKIGYQGGKVDIVRPRVRGADGEEIALPSWTAAATEDWLGKTAMNLMLIGSRPARSGAPSGCRMDHSRASMVMGHRSQPPRAGS